MNMGMKWIRSHSWADSGLALAARLLLICVLAHAASAAQAGNGARVVEGELLVKFRGGPRGDVAARAQRVFQHEVKRHFDLIGWQHIQLPPDQTVADALERYRRHPDVLAAEPNYVLQAAPMCATAAIPNDPRFIEQWALLKIGASNAWATSTGSSNVVVAVIDSGVRYTHDDLAPNMWRNPGESGGGKENNGIDDDGNGYIDDVYGIDVVSHDSDPAEGLFGAFTHGTYCAGVIGAAGNNGRGIAGVNWSVRLMALRFLSQSGAVTSDTFVESCNYVLDQKSRGVNVRVTSSSWGFSTNNPGDAVRDAINGLGQAGILNVFAAGNEGLDVDGPVKIFPQSWHLPGMINVASSDGTDNRPSSSNYGATNVDLAAPGVSILTTEGSSATSYGTFSGTSMACPHVASAAALLWAAYPYATLAQIKTALLESVDVLPAFTNKVLSNGRLNLAQAIQHPILSTGAPPFVTVPPQSQLVGLGYPAAFCVTATGAQPINYFWRFNSSQSPPDTEPTLTFSSVTLQDAGEYSVVLSNSFGVTTSAVATLTVVTNPMILAQPQSIRVLDATNISLNVLGVGAYPLAYQWQRDGENINGATEATLPFNNTVSSMSGEYRAVLSNGYGSVTTFVARVTVLTRPYVIVQPQSQTVPVGADVALSITVTNTATLPIGYRWRNPQLRGLMVSNEYTVVTNFPSIQTNAAGVWSVILTNEAPSGVSFIFSSNAYLTVVVPPTNQMVQPGTTVAFSAIAVGPAPITYQWLHAGTNLPNAASGTLTLQNVQPPHAGNYSVVVRNAIGQPATFNASLQLIVPQPVFSQMRVLSDGSFQASLQGLLNQQDYVVERSSTLTNWNVLKVFTATNSSEAILDSTAPESTRRFYRARSAPQVQPCSTLPISK